jgi:Flp pilus assembly protein TadD
MRRSKAEWTAVALLLMSCLLPSHAKAQGPDPDSAITLERQGKLSEADKVWRAIVQQNPSDAAAFASLGVVLSKERESSITGSAT